MNDHLSIDGKYRFAELLKGQPRHLTTMETHSAMRTPRSMVLPLHKLYVSKSTRRLIRNLVLIVIGAMSVAWMCVPR